MSKVLVKYVDQYGDPKHISITASDIQLKEGVIAFLDDEDSLTFMLPVILLLSVVPIVEPELG